MSLLYLSTEDFGIAKGIKGPTLCTSIKGFSLVLFYGEKCPYSQNLLPIWKKLPSSIGSCQFGMINVERNMLCIEMSKKTISPIKYVPYIVLYINGKPYMAYKGPHEIEDIKRFIFDVSKNISQNQKNITEMKTSSGASIRNIPSKGIPEYCIGIPLYGDGDVTYLDFDNNIGYKQHSKRPTT